MPKGARKQMTEEQEYIYENTKLIPNTLSLIEKELEQSIKESERLDKSIKELRKKRLAKKKSKKEESSSDSSSDSSSEDEKPKMSKTAKLTKERRDLTENNKLTDTFTEKSVKLDIERQKYDIKKLIKSVDKKKELLEKMKAKKKTKKEESSSDSSSSSLSEDEKPKMSKTAKLTKERRDLTENTKLNDSYNSKLNEREASKMVDTATKNNAELKKLKEANIRLKKRIQELNLVNSDSSSYGHI